MTTRWSWLRLLTFGILAACSSSSSGTEVGGGDAGHRRDSATGHDAAADARRDAASCSATGAMPTCTGTLSGGVDATLTACSLTREEGLAEGFGEYTFELSATGGAGVGAIAGSGNVSTKNKFAVGKYTPTTGLWNDTGTTGVAADSLWTISWSPSASSTVMAECNGIASPDEIDSICSAVTFDITSIDACDAAHGTLDLTVPAYAGPPSTPAVTVHLTF